MHTAILLVLLTVTVSNGVTALFMLSPESVIVYLGDQASFSCITDGSHLLVWSVNGVEARFPEVRNKGINFVYSGANSEMSNLTVLASLQNNNSEIICIQQNVMTGQELTRTTPVYLYIQGLLEAPSNITVDFKNQTVIHLTWLPPFSLKEILGYVITISLQSNREVSDEVQTILSEFTYTWIPGHSYCNNFIFKVAAINALGASNTSGGIVTGFCRSFVEVSPSSQTVRVGQWVNFTCGIQCSQTDLIVWFLNDSTLLLFQNTGLDFQRYPRHSHCSTSGIVNKENHTLSLMINYDLGLPLVVHCAVISGCEKSEPHCISHTCFSDSAHFEFLNQSESISVHYTSTSDSLKSQDEPYSDRNILFGTSLGLGIMLFTLFSMITVIMVCCCHRNKKLKPQKIHEVIYDTPAIIVPPSALNELETKKNNLDQPMGPTALQYCLAYQTSSCARRS